MTGPSGPAHAGASGSGRRVLHYEILSEIGRGGMGVVYRARDLRLGREVALKCPCPDLADDHAGRRRFLREARAASSLSHPNVVQVHEVFEHDGLPWIAMELVEGVSLRALIEKQGPLPCLDVLGHAEGLADALGAAHRSHFLHRDITPRNILIGRDGRARLTDFGLARCYVPPEEISSASTESGEVSERGSIIGTPQYMAPEQALGKQADPRSDIFSLGAVLYEMCTGRPAFGPAPRGELLDALLHHEPQAISRFTYEVPEELERIVRKCLAKRPEERYQDAADLLADIRALRRREEAGEVAVPEERRPRRLRAWIWGGALAAGLAAALLYLLYLGPGPPRDLPEREVPSSARAYYERGLQYLTSDRETLGTLDDAIQMFHRAVAEDPAYALAYASLGEAYWIRYGRWTHDAASREEAVHAVEEALRLAPDLPEAHNARARGLIEEGNHGAARQALEKIVETSPGFHDAWTNLAWACRELEDYACGLRALGRATELQPGDFRDQIWLGRFYEHFAEYEAAAAAYRKAADLNADSATAWNNLASMHLHLGRPAEALPAFERSLQIEDDADVRSNLGTAHFFLGDYGKAEECYRKAVDLAPGMAVHRANLGDALKMLGKDEEARQAYASAVPLAREELQAAPQDASLRMRLGLYCARAGEAACALAEGSRAAEMQPASAEIAFRNAIVRVLVGREEEALDWLEKAVKMGISRAQIENDPDLPGLRRHDRYAKIVRLAS